MTHLQLHNEIMPSKLILDYSPLAKLFEHDMRHFCGPINAAVQSLKDPSIQLQSYVQFLNPYTRKMATMRREQVLLSDEEVEYKFSNLTVYAQRCTPEIRTLMEIVNDNFIAAGKRKFDRVLVNIYAGKQPGEPRDYISQHGDKGVEGDVVGISAGGCRVFRVSRMVAGLDGKMKSETVKDVIARPYHALVMKGDEFQKLLQHGVPQINIKKYHFEDKIIPSDADGIRYSFTFRHHKEPETKKRKRSNVSPPVSTVVGSV